MTDPNPFDAAGPVLDDLTLDDLAPDPDGGDALVVREGAAAAIQAPVLDVVSIDQTLAALLVDRRRIVDTIMAEHDDVQALDRRIAVLRAARAEAFALVAALFRDRTQGVQFRVSDDYGTLAATWPKPALRAKADRSLADVLRDADNGDPKAREVAEYLGLHWDRDKASAPTVTWRPKT